MKKELCCRLFVSLLAVLCFVTSFGPRDAAAQRKTASGSILPAGFYTHRYIDVGGLKNKQTGQWLEAFRLLVPQGWKFTGGLKWILKGKDPRQLTRMELIAPARTSFAIISPDNRAALQLYPEVFFSDLSQAPERLVGVVRPLWSNYGGTLVCPMLTPPQYLTKFVIPRNRGQITGLRIVSQKEMPEVAAGFKKEAEVGASIMKAYGIANLVFRAGLVSVEYNQNGITYREDFFAVLQYLQMQGVSMWWPRSTASARAPKADYNQFAPFFITSLTSIRVNLRWFFTYKQMTDKAWRGIQIVDKQMREIDDQITANRRQLNAKIHNDMYKILAPYGSKEGPDGEEYFLENGKLHFIDPTGNIRSFPKPPERGDWKPLKNVGE